MRRISFKLFAEGCEKLSLLPLKQTWEQPWVPTGRMPNKPGPVSAGSGEIPLNEGHLAVPDRASSNTSSPYVSQLIPNIRKYIEHTAQTTRACAANAFFSIRQLQLCNTHAPTISISIYLNHTIIFVSSSYTAFLNQKQINILCA